MSDKTSHMLDKAVENFKRDTAIFSADSSKPVTEADLHTFSIMVLNALADIKNSFD